MDNFREWLSDNLRYILLGLAIILVLVIAIFVVKLVGGSGNSTNGNKSQPETISLAGSGETETSTEQSTDQPAGNSGETEAPTAEGLTENDPKILAYANEYFTAVANKDFETVSSLVEGATEDTKKEIESGVIQAYENITVYSKTGPEDSSYVAYIRYDAKLDGVETLVPSLTYLYLKTREDGSLYALKATGEVADQVNAMKQDEDVQALINSINEEYQSVLNSNEDLRSILAEMATPDTEVDIPDASDTGVEANKVVMCLEEDVNVRADSTTQADVIGVLQKGATLTRLQKLDNGWSQVRYGDSIGYVSSEFLTEDLNALDGE